jgi:hypothetical protein
LKPLNLHYFDTARFCRAGISFYPFDNLLSMQLKDEPTDLLLLDNCLNRITQGKF